VNRNKAVLNVGATEAIHALLVTTRLCCRSRVLSMQADLHLGWILFRLGVCDAHHRNGSCLVVNRFRIPTVAKVRIQPDVAAGLRIADCVADPFCFPGWLRAGSSSLTIFYASQRKRRSGR